MLASSDWKDGCLSDEWVDFVPWPQRTWVMEDRAGGYGKRPTGSGQSCALGDVEVNAPNAADSAFLQTQFAQQFVFGGKADEIEMDGLHLAFGGALLGQQHEQQGGDQSPPQAGGA